MAILSKKVCVLGLGYIGLPTASLLGAKGYKVYGVDTSQDVLRSIAEGQILIDEPDLDILVKSAVRAGNLTVGPEPIESDIYIIAVPTPFTTGHKPDLSCVEAAVKSIAPLVKRGDLVILESTVPVGTTEGLVAKLLRDAGHDVEKEIFVVHSPERVLPGKILAELIQNDRIVGGISELATEKATEFYETFMSGKVLTTNASTAELAKLAENAFRDVNIAYANELSMICDKEGINVWNLITLANRHPRVNILNPGPGVGGHCIAVDPWFIVDRAPELARIIRTAREVNDHKPEWVVEKVKISADRFKRPVIGCLGLAFKADVQDLRQSPAVEIVRRLQEQNIGEILVSEPTLSEHKEFHLLPWREVIERSDIVVVLVDHKQFRKIKGGELKEKIVIDTRGIIE